MVIRISEMDGETVLSGTLLTTKFEQNNDPDSPWFEGWKYVMLIDDTITDEKSMDLLYSKIYRLQNAPH